MSVRQTGVFEPAGKTQAVHQSEYEGHDPRRTGGDTNMALPATQNQSGRVPNQRGLGFGLALWRKKKGDPFWDRPFSSCSSICGYRVELVRK